MRTLRSTLTGAVILGLLAGPSIAVAAQVEGEMPPMPGPIEPSAAALAVE